MSATVSNSNRLKNQKALPFLIQTAPKLGPPPQPDPKHSIQIGLQEPDEWNRKHRKVLFVQFKPKDADEPDEWNRKHRKELFVQFKPKDADELDSRVRLASSKTHAGRHLPLRVYSSL